MSGDRVHVLRVGRWLSARYRPRALAVALGAAVLALAVAVVALGSGEFAMDPWQVLRILAGHGSPAGTFIIDQVRLPRVATGLLVGAALGLSGTLFQTVVGNPLGSPDVLGFTSGASAGALVAIVLLGGGSLAVAGGAVVGGLVTGVVIYGLAWRRGASGYRLILVGIGVAAILTGVNGYLLTSARIVDAQRAVLWLTGSLDGRGWNDAVPLLLSMVVLVPVALGGMRGLGLLQMGDDTARSLGVGTQRLRLMVLATAVLLASFAAAAAGPVAFVALTAPQVARRMTRAPGPNLIASLCTGAALLVVADLAAQRAFGDRQLPVGVVTGVLGGGYLVWLLATERRAGRL